MKTKKKEMKLARIKDFKRKAFWGGLVILSLFSCNAPEEKKSLHTKLDSLSYVIGYDYGEGVKAREIEVNAKKVYQGFVDALQGKSMIDDSAKQRFIRRFNDELKRRDEKTKAEEAEKNREAGRKFLQEIARQKGIKKTAHGVYYEVVKEGKGASPKPGDSILIHYQASFIDGKVFDDSYAWGPAHVKVGEAIEGLNEAFQIMKPQGRYIFYIPPELAYGNYNFANVVPPGSTLTYKVEFLRKIK